MEILIIIVALILQIAAAVSMSLIASMKGHDKSRYFWWCLFVPIYGYPMVIALPDRRGPQAQGAASAVNAAPAVDEDELPEL